MNCPRCNIEMKRGIALPEYEEQGVRAMRGYVVTADNLEFVDCLKCPKCGHSDDDGLVTITIKYDGVSND